LYPEPWIELSWAKSAHAVFGRWSDLVVHEWTPLELAVNPFAIFRADVIGARGWFSFNSAPLVNFIVLLHRKHSHENRAAPPGCSCSTLADHAWRRERERWRTSPRRGQHLFALTKTK
jgi:hypothetical protein